MSLMHLWREILSEYVQLSNLPAAKNYVDGDMADVPKSLYRRYLEVSEATFQASLKNHAAGEIQHYKPIFNFPSPHKGFEGCLPCLFCNTLGN
jgi:hypothetical protein